MPIICYFATKENPLFVHSSRILKQIEHLKNLGIDVKPALLLAGIKEKELIEADKNYSFEQFHTILEYGIKESNDEFYGLKMGQEHLLAGSIGMMCASCSNLREAFRQGCNFFKIQGDFANIRFEEEKLYSKITYIITDEWLLKNPATAKQETETMFSFLIQILRNNSNNSVKPYRINFSHSGPENLSTHIKILNTKPFFCQTRNELIFRSRDLLIPMKAFNQGIYEILKNHFNSQLKKIGKQEKTSEKVKTILLSCIQYQFPDIETVASKLNIGTRTLQRQLSNENTSFKIILQNTRFNLALVLLKENNLTISEIACSLGYSDLANFSRSFKKHSGLSPQDYRNNYL